jgi:hypothetical protein
MSLLDKFANKLVDKSEALGEEGVDKLIAAAREELPDEGASNEGDAIRETSLFALEKLESHKGRIAELGKEQLVHVLTWIGLGKHENAVRVFVGAQAGSDWAAAHSDIADSGDATEQAKRDRDAAVAFVKSVGSLAATKLLPLVLTLL